MVKATGLLRRFAPRKDGSEAYGSAIDSIEESPVMLFSYVNVLPVRRESP